MKDAKTLLHLFCLWSFHIPASHVSLVLILLPKVLSYSAFTTYGNVRSSCRINENVEILKEMLSCIIIIYYQVSSHS